MEVSFFREETLKGDNVRIENDRLYFFLFLLFFSFSFCFIFLFLSRVRVYV